MKGLSWFLPVLVGGAMVVISIWTADYSPPAKSHGHLNLIVEETFICSIPSNIFELEFTPKRDLVAYIGQVRGGYAVIINGKEGARFDHIQDPTDTSWVRFSRDAWRVAYVGKRSGKEMAVVDGREGPLFDEVEMRSFRFSPDGKRFGYLASQNQKWVAVIDDVVSPGEFITRDGLRSPVFSEDGKHVAYGGRGDEGWFVVIDGKKGPFFDDLKTNLAGRIVDFTADGCAVYRAEKGRKAIAVVDGVVGPGFTEIGLPILSKGKESHIGYVATNVTETGGTAVVMVDGKEALSFGIAYALTFSPNGARSAYVARKGNKYLVIVDGRVGPEFDGTGKPVFSPDGKHVAYRAVEDGKTFLVVNEQRVGNSECDRMDIPEVRFTSKGILVYIAVRGENLYLVQWTSRGIAEKFAGHLEPGYSDHFTISPDGERVAYLAGAGPWEKAAEGATEVDQMSQWARHWLKQRAVLNGKGGPIFDKIEEPVFTADGKLVYRGQIKGNWAVVLDGKVGRFSRHKPRWVAVSPGRKGVFYVREEGAKQFAVIDGRIGSAYDGIYSPAFSPDGEHLAYEGWSKALKKKVVVADEKEGAQFNRIHGLGAHPDGGFVYIGQRGLDLFRVNLRPSTEW